MKLALATWNGRISPVFDVARQVLLLDIQDGRVAHRHVEMLPGTEPNAQAHRLSAFEPHTLICGAISRPMAALLATKEIAIIPFTAGSVEEVLSAWLAGALPNAALSMPGCCGHMRQCRGRGRGAGRRRGRGWYQTQDPTPNTHTPKE